MSPLTFSISNNSVVLTKKNWWFAENKCEVLYPFYLLNKLEFDHRLPESSGDKPVDLKEVFFIREMHHSHKWKQHWIPGTALLRITRLGGNGEATPAILSSLDFVLTSNQVEMFYVFFFFEPTRAFYFRYFKTSCGHRQSYEVNP